MQNILVQMITAKFSHFDQEERFSQKLLSKKGGSEMALTVSVG